MPDKNGKSPFDLAVSNSSYRSIEIMLAMLNLSKDSNA
jgi:hypothetical protein